MPILLIDVKGTPGAQGSKRHVGRGVMVESSKKVAPWRSDVRDAAIAAMGDTWQPLTGPVVIGVTFYFLRPKSHYGTGRNAATLKPSAPITVTSRAHGDLDKLVRSTLDALVSAGVLRDDSLVVDLTARKRWGYFSGCYLTVSGGES